MSVGLASDRRESLSAELLSSGALVLAIKAVSAGLAFAANVMLARVLGPAGYGAYAFALAVAGTVGLIATVGLPTLAVRETAAATARESWTAVRGLVHWSTRFTVAISTGLSCFVGAITWMVVDGQTTLLWIALAMVPPTAVALVVEGHLRGLGSVVGAQIPEGLVRPGLYVMAVVPLALMGRLTPLAALLALAASTLVSLGVALVLLGRRMPRHRERSAPEPARWIRATIPLALVGAMQIVMEHTDVLMLGLLTDAAETGIYRTAHRTSLIIGFALVAANVVLQPTFAKLWVLGRRPTIERLAIRSSRTTLAMVAPVVVIFVVVGGPVLGFVYGPAFAVGGTALALLTVGQAANVATGSVGNLLMMTGFGRDVALTTAIGMGGNVVLNALLIPPFGVTGAALATSLSLVSWNAMLAVRVRHRLGIGATAVSRRLADERAY